MEIVGSMKDDWLVRMKKNEIAKIVGVDEDSQVSPSLKVGRKYSISSRWNLIKMLKAKKSRFKTISQELNDMSDSI